MSGYIVAVTIQMHVMLDAIIIPANDRNICEREISRSAAFFRSLTDLSLSRERIS